MKRKGCKLTGAASNPFDFEFAFDGVGLGIVAGSQEEFVGDAFLESFHVIEGGPGGAGGEVREGEVDAALGRGVDGGMIDDAAVGNTGRFFPGGGIFEGGKEELEGILAGTGVDEVERVFDDVIEEVFFPRVFPAFHKAINEAFNDVGISFGEAFIGVATEVMKNEGGLKRNIAFKAGIGDGALFGGPFIEKAEIFRIVNQGTHQITRGKALGREGWARRVRRV